MGGLLQAGLLVELGFPSWRTGSKPYTRVGGGLLQTLPFLIMSKCGNGL